MSIDDPHGSAIRVCEKQEHPYEVDISLDDPNGSAISVCEKLNASCADGLDMEDPNDDHSPENVRRIGPQTEGVSESISVCEKLNANGRCQHLPEVPLRTLVVADGES